MAGTQGYADLHVHTSLSDSVFSPEDIVRHALSAGLKAVAITDHDEVDGVEAVARLATPEQLEVIAGVELSAETDDGEVHMLGFMMDDSGPLRGKLSELRSVRLRRMKTMVDKLNELKVHIPLQAVLDIAGSGSVGRPHLARAMMDAGYVNSVGEAFGVYLAEGKPGYVRKYRLSCAEAIELILESRGVPVLAHPGISVRTDELIPSLVETGLRGLEVYCPGQDSVEERKYLELAKRYGLVVTGGSDCHGQHGKGLVGSVKIPYRLVEELRRCKRRLSHTGGA